MFTSFFCILFTLESQSLLCIEGLVVNRKSFSHVNYPRNILEDVEDKLI